MPRGVAVEATKLYRPFQNQSMPPELLYNTFQKLPSRLWGVNPGNGVLFGAKIGSLRVAHSRAETFQGGHTIEATHFSGFQSSSLKTAGEPGMVPQVYLIVTDKG